MGESNDLYPNIVDMFGDVNRIFKAIGALRAMMTTNKTARGGFKVRDTDVQFYKSCLEDIEDGASFLCDSLRDCLTHKSVAENFPIDNQN